MGIYSVNNSELITKVRFDFPLLLCEVVRHGLPCRPFESWRFVDTVAVLQTTSREIAMPLPSHHGRDWSGPPSSSGGCHGKSPAVSWRIVIPRRAVDPPRLSTIA